MGVINIFDSVGLIAVNFKKSLLRLDLIFANQNKHYKNQCLILSDVVGLLFPYDKNLTRQSR